MKMTIEEKTKLVRDYYKVEVHPDKIEEAYQNMVKLGKCEREHREQKHPLGTLKLIK